MTDHQPTEPDDERVADLVRKIIADAVAAAPRRGTADPVAASAQDRLVEEMLAYRWALKLGNVQPHLQVAAEQHFAARVREVDAALGIEWKTLVDLELAIMTGEDCETLVGIKSAMDKKDPDYKAASQRLIEVGCYSRRSTRTDLP